MYGMKLKLSMVGVRPLNRDGSGLNPMDVHELLGDITSAGWLEARVVAIAVEPTCEAEIKWNVNLFQQAVRHTGSKQVEGTLAGRLPHQRSSQVFRSGDLAPGR